MLYEHCGPELKALLKGDDNWGNMEADQDSIRLLRMIKGLCCKFDLTKQETRAIVAADKAIICYVQEGHVSNSQYFERFNALVDTAISYGSSIGHSKVLVNSKLAKMGIDRDDAPRRKQQCPQDHDGGGLAPRRPPVAQPRIGESETGQRGHNQQRPATRDVAGFRIGCRERRGHPEGDDGAGDHPHGGPLVTVGGQSGGGRVVLVGDPGGKECHRRTRCTDTA